MLEEVKMKFTSDILNQMCDIINQMENVSAKGFKLGELQLHGTEIIVIRIYKLYHKICSKFYDLYQVTTRIDTFEKYF